MFDCVAIGDVIAYNVSPILQCETRAASGLSSSRVINIAGGTYHMYCIISAGGNEAGNPKLSDNLMHIRNQSKCKFYVWIEPINKLSATAVAKVAQSHNDYVVTFLPGSDNTTPLSYSDLAGSILQVTGN